jgi:5'(3')-deoxyribonucleotidase
VLHPLPSKVRIAVDVDGVLLNTAEKWIEIFNKKYGKNKTIDIMNDWDWHEGIGMSKKEFLKILKKACESILYVQPCFELAQHNLFLLRKHHVDIVTSSVADKDLLIERLEQLHIRKGYEYKKFIQVSPNQKNAKLDLGYDIYIDDNPRLAEAIDNKGDHTYCILVTQPWNKIYQPKHNVMRAYNWRDIREGVELFKKILDMRECPIELS